MLLLGTKQDADISGTVPDNVTENFLQMSYGEGFDNLAREVAHKTRVHITIDVQW